MFAPLIAKQKTKSGEFSRAPVDSQRHHQPAVSQVQLLQRRIGNQALLRLFAQRGNEPGAPSNAALLRGVLQPKLKIGTVNDPLEHEADRVADHVMRMPAPDVALSSAPEQISRKCEECEEEEEKLQMKEAGPQAATGEAPASVHEVLRSPGQPLDAATRAFMEPRFGQDFSSVRVHSDAAAAQSTRDVNAHAYTVGHDMVFGAGRFAPGTHEGQRLIAHELTHVVQQSSPSRMNVSKSNDTRSLSSISPSPITPISFIGQAPDRSIQRDPEPKTPEKGSGTPVEKVPTKSLEEENRAALLELKEIESNWKEMRDSAAGFSDVADWLSKGDTVIGLLRTHTELAIDATARGDSALSKLLTSFVESDLVMYRFIAWHVAVFVNLLSLEPQMKDLSDSFAADNRAFTGRAEAEERVKLLTQLAGVYRKQAPKLLELVKILPAEVTGTSGRKITLTVTIAAHQDKSVSDLFAKGTEQFIKDQGALETLVSATNQFLDTAFKEGLLQAAEAVVEFYLVRGSRRGGPKATKKKGKGKRKEEKKKEKKKEKEKQKKCAALYAAMKVFCDKPRSCSMQGDTCYSATEKVAAGIGCVEARTKLQQQCFSPGDPGYEGHMRQIAQASAALLNCEAVMAEKCKQN